MSKTPITARILRIASATSVMIGITLMTSNVLAAIVIGLGVLLFAFYVEDIQL